jgi:hypothetical protein
VTIDGYPTDDLTNPTTELEWRKMMRWLMEPGVILGQLNEYAVSERAAGANMSVDVATGHAFLVGHMVISDAIESVPITSNGTGNPRIDLVVIGFDFATNVADIYALAGTPAGSPVAPTPTEDLDTLWEIGLASIAVAAGAVSILTANITDVRTIVDPFAGGGGFNPVLNGAFL